VCFHDQVRVVALERVVGDAEVPALARLGQGAPPLVDQLASRNDGTPGRTRSVTWTGQCTGTAALSRCSTRGRGPRGRPEPGRGPPRPVRIRWSVNESCLGRCGTSKG
jgi:hypothetical protein